MSLLRVILDKLPGDIIQLPARYLFGQTVHRCFWGERLVGIINAEDIPHTKHVLTFAILQELISGHKIRGCRRGEDRQSNGGEEDAHEVPRKKQVEICSPPASLSIEPGRLIVHREPAVALTQLNERLIGFVPETLQVVLVRLIGIPCHALGPVAHGHR